MLLAPYLDRICIAGPNVFLEPDPTFGLSMAMHELDDQRQQARQPFDAADGRVEVTWTGRSHRSRPDADPDWKERDGPAPKRNRRAGFGSELINMVIERQLNGDGQQTFGPKGLDAS